MENINDENITYEFKDEEICGNEDELNKLLFEFEHFNMVNGGINDEVTVDDNLYTDMLNYDTNYTVKQLLLICEYYGLLKDVKTNKLKKQDIIEQILLYENNIDNYDMMCKRKELWFYMNELKNDKMMKKYIIWN
jgi:hypothetical protein